MPDVGDLADTTSPLSSFERAIAAEPLGGGRYSVELDPAWRGPIAPNGGVLAAIAVRAAEAELGSPAPAPRMIAAHFLEAAPIGPAEVEVEVLRRGKRVAAADTRLLQGEKLICRTTIVFSASRDQDLDLTAASPRVPPPEAVAEVSEEFRAGLPPQFHQLEIRPLFGPLPDGSRDGETVTGGWVGLRDDDDGALIDAARLCALSDLWWPAIFSRMTTFMAVPTLQLTVHVRRVDAAVHGPVLVRFQTHNVIEGHAEEAGEIWSADGRLLAESRQLALLPPPRP